MSSINRKCHCMKGEKSLAMPRHIIFFDVETKLLYKENGDCLHRLRLGWACHYSRAYGRHAENTEWLYFEDAFDFWQFVESHTERKQKLWVIAHNIVFDFTVLSGWRHLRLAGYKLKFFHSTGKVSIISVRATNKSLLFVDNMNWFLESVEQIGNRIGLDKIDVDFENVSDLKLSEHCRRDVAILLENFKYFMSFLESKQVSRLCYTKGSTAMATYLLNHYTHKIWIHNNQQAVNLERESYRGGRVECFFIGELNHETYYVLDVNSLYPFVMANNLYPTRYKTMVDKIDRSALAEYLKTRSMVAKVLIETDEPVYALRTERTIFPTGRFWITLTTPELQHAVLHDHIRAVKVAIIYDNADIFSTFVKRFYGLRRQFQEAGQEIYEQFTKYLMNSLYGKFGQKGEVWTKIGDCSDEPDRVEMMYDVVNNQTRRIRYLLGEIFELTGHEETFDSFPAISSHVTAYARMYLYGLMQQAGRGNYFYCDTDSLIVNEAGLCNLKTKIDNSCLGSLKIQETTSDLTIRGLKDYSTAKKTVIKGIRKNARLISDGVYEQDRWPSFRGILRTGDVNTYTVEKTIKHLNRLYKKGVLMPDGSVIPYLLSGVC